MHHVFQNFGGRWRISVIQIWLWWIMDAMQKIFNEPVDLWPESLLNVTLVEALWTLVRLRGRACVERYCASFLTHHVAVDRS